MRNYDALVYNQTTSATFSSSVVDVKEHSHVSFQGNFDGNLVGIMYMTLSNDGVTFIEPTDESGNPTTRKAITAPQNHLLEVVDVCANYARMEFTRSSGTGAVSVYTGNKGAS